MTWCFSTRASEAAVLTMHPCVSRCLRVNRLTLRTIAWVIMYIYNDFSNFQVIYNNHMNHIEDLQMRVNIIKNLYPKHKEWLNENLFVDVSFQPFVTFITMTLTLVGWPSLRFLNIILHLKSPVSVGQPRYPCWGSTSMAPLLRSHWSGSNAQEIMNTGLAGQSQATEESPPKWPPAMHWTQDRDTSHYIYVVASPGTSISTRVKESPGLVKSGYRLSWSWPS